MNPKPLAQYGIAGACLLISAAAAGQSGDPVAGKYAFATCSGCHAIPGYTNAYPTYRIPKLAGQHPEYLQAALLAYQQGLREHSTMHANAVGLSPEDINNVAAYLAEAEVSGAGGPLRGDPRAGEQKSQTCIACHGQDGATTTSPTFPKLAGQYEDYLAHSLRAYRAQTRENALMNATAATLSDQDILDLAAYYASLEPALDVVEYDGND